MKTEKDFWTHLREYFTVYLPKQRNMSPNTIVSSKQTWNIFLFSFYLSISKDA